MNLHMTPEMASPVRSQEIGVTYKGKAYAIIGAAQMASLVEGLRERLAMDASDGGEQVSPEDLDRRVRSQVEGMGVATLKEVLDKMTPEEQARWAMQYRFSGITRKRS